MLFLVEGNVTFTPYMGSSQKTKTIRLVEANSAEEALTQVGLKVDGINIYSIYCYELASDEIFFK